MLSVSDSLSATIKWRKNVSGSDVSVSVKTPDFSSRVDALSYAISKSSDILPALVDQGDYFGVFKVSYRPFWHDAVSQIINVQILHISHIAIYRPLL